MVSTTCSDTYSVLTLLTISEICYNVLHVQKHGRKLPDPWSLRQTGIYHQMVNDQLGSRWIVLDLQGDLQANLKDFLESRTDYSHLAMHLELLIAMGSNWSEYIEFLGSELRKQVSFAVAYISYRLTISERQGMLLNC